MRSVSVKSGASNTATRPGSREEHKNYIPPGGWSPKIFDGGPIPIKQVLLQCSKNRGGWGV